MQMRPEIQITSMIKALTDVVIPAIDPVNKLAIEQSRLIVGLLNLMASQLPVQVKFDRDELARLATCSRTLIATVSADSGIRTAIAQLETCTDTALGLLERNALTPADLVGGVRKLKAAVGTLVTVAAASTDIDAQLRIERIVLTMSKEQLLRDRSLMKLQGFEPNPAALPEIMQLLVDEPVRP
jgi:hypothetical protein